MKTISTQTISKIIGHVYDCAIDPSRWPEALAEINATLGYLHAVLGVYARAESTPILHITAGLHSPWLEMWPQFVPSAAEYWGGHDRVMSFPLEEPVAASIIVPANVASENAFCNRWMRPQHIVDLVAVTLVQEPRTFGSYVLARHESNGLATPSDLAIMRSLAPHVRRATEISRLFDPKPPEAAAYESLIESLASGVIFADAQAQIISVNRAARVMLENGDLARSMKGRLVLDSDFATKALEDALARACGDVLTLGARGIGIPTRCSDGSAAVAHVLPLTQGSLRARIERKAVAAIFISRAAQPRELQTEALQLLYDLTPAETRILMLAVEGLTQVEIAKRLGIAPSTAKTHLLNVYAKTNTNRRAELVRLIDSLSIRL